MDRIFEEKRFLRGTLYVDSVMSRERQRITFQFGRLGATPQTATLTLLQIPGVYEKLAKALEDSDVLDNTSIGEIAIPIWALKPIVRRLAMTLLLIERDNLVEQVNINTARETKQEAAFYKIEKALSAANQATNELRAERTHHLENIGSLQAQLEILTADKADMEVTLTSLDEELTDSKLELSSRESQLENQKYAFNELGDTLQDERNTQEAQQQTVTEQESQLKNIMSRVGELQKRTNEHGAVLAQKDARISELTSAIQEVAAAARVASSKIAENIPKPTAAGAGIVK